MEEAWVYYTVLEDPHEEMPRHITEQLPPLMAEEILRYKKVSDINRLTAGKYLLKKALNDTGNIDLLHQYAIDEMGKPYIKNWHPFNITHSGKVVALVILPAAGVIGIDVEKIREIEVTRFHKQFSPPEMMRILAAPNPQAMFFDSWTQKEAVMKADGRGMRIPLHSIRLKGDHATVDDQNFTFYLYPLDLHPTVKAHVCSTTQLTHLEKKNIPVKQLFGN